MLRGCTYLHVVSSLDHQSALVLRFVNGMIPVRPLVKSAYQKIIFLFLNQIMCCGRRFFWAPTTYGKNDGEENIYNFTLKNFA